MANGKGLLVFAGAAGVAALVWLHPHHKSHPPPTTPAYPVYTQAKCQLDATNDVWQWMSDNGTPVLCGLPQGNEPQPPVSPYYPPYAPQPQPPDWENYR